ncbi:MAG: flagellar hook-length control protein FliK [Treponema sp.]|nr:flagellar hook-length control protein FliK [Treponema sp.]
MVITLSAYTQPPPIDTSVALSELPQIHENSQIHEHENDKETFAEIMAGILNKTGEEEEQSTVEETPEDSLQDFTGVEFDPTAFTGEVINFIKPETVNIAQEEFSESGISEMEISETEFFEISKNYLNGVLDEDVQVSAEAVPLEDAELPQDFFDVETPYMADFPQETVTISASSAQKTLFDETRVKEIKKDGAFSQTGNVENALTTGRSKEPASLQKETEKDGNGKLGQTAGKNKKDKVAFEVRDMRSYGADSQNNMQIKAGAQMPDRVQSAPVKEITLELRLPQQAQSSAQTAWEAKAGGTAVENMLARELHQNFNGDIVRHASMALHDGGEGVIKLALKPDSLGNVKIHLKMSENKITGHIVVESEEALNAFKKEITSLEQAFRESGFTNAQLNLSLTADQRNADWQQQSAPSFLPGLIADRYNESFKGDSLPIVDVFFGQRHGSVNMLA